MKKSNDVIKSKEAKEVNKLQEPTVLSKSDKLEKEIFEWVKLIAIVFVIVFVTNNFLIVNATVPSESMVPTIVPGDRVLANRLAYIIIQPKRGEIITFTSLEDGGKTYIKRLIGLPGEVVEIKDGHVYINGTLLDETYLNPSKDNRSFGPFTVPENHYFFLGDNRCNSYDARLWKEPYIDKKEILGKGMIEYYPKIKWLY